jgi:hypothetical protein
MADRIEVLVCQLADFTISPDDSVEVHLLLPDGGATKRCKIFPAKYPSEKGQKDAILAFQSGKFQRGESYATTIKFRPAPNNGEYRNITSMSTTPTNAPATPSNSASPGRRTDATGISIERQVAAKAATDKTSDEGTLEERLAEWNIWANHVINWIQEVTTDEPTPASAEEAPALETLAEAAVFDPESMRDALLEASGGDRQKVGLAIADAGFDSFADMGEADILKMIEGLKAVNTATMPGF